MSPEQALGQPLDARSDVFSFGVLLYELLTGRRPFGGATELDRLQAIVDGAFVPLPVELPEALRSIVEKSLEREPTDRYQSMRELVVDLRRVARRTAAPQTNEHANVALRSAHRHQPVAIAAAAIVVVAVIGVATLWYNEAKVAGDTRIDALVSSRPVTTYVGSEVSPSFAPDGERIAFAWGGESGANSDIYVAQLGSTTPQRLTTATAADSYPHWSPDGTQIAFFRRTGPAGGEILLIPALGGPERKIVDIEFRTSEVGNGLRSPLSWTPDGRGIVYSTLGAQSGVYGMHTVALATGEVVPLGAASSGVLGDLSPLVSPDRRWLAFTRFTSGPTVGVLMAQPLRSSADGSLATEGEPFAITEPTQATQPIAWSPDSNSLVIVGNRALYEWSARPGEPIRSLYATTAPLESATVNWKDGAARIVASLTNVDNDLHRVTLDPMTHRAVGSPQRRASSTQSDAQPQLSPDGTRLMFVSSRTGNAEIWLADADGENARQHTRLGAFLIGFASFSPDGKRIAFHARIEGVFNAEPRLYYVDVDGNGIAQQISDGALGLNVPSWSRNGEYVLSTSFITGRSRIYRTRLADGTSEFLIEGDLPRVSFDETKLFYVQVGRDGLFARSLVGDIASNPETVVIADYRPLLPWQVARDGLYYSSVGADNVRRIRFVDERTQQPTEVIEVSTPVDSFGLSADGTTLWYAALQGSAGSDLTLLEFEVTSQP
jgi:Tol biopolymer transport system component